MDTNEKPTDILRDFSCDLFEPITWRETDTAATLRQIKQHNAAWDSLCKDSPQPFVNEDGTRDVKPVRLTMGS